MKKKIIFVALIAVNLIACNKVTDKNSNSKASSDDIIGTKFLIKYPEMKADMEILSDHSLHWHTVNNQNESAEGNETINYKKIGDNLFFVNWIEADGTTVSQVIDKKNNIVRSFVSFADEKSERGNRTGELIQGEILTK